MNPLPDQICLQVTDLFTHFPVEKELVRSVDNVSFSMKQGQTLALVGESGSGKSVTSLSLMGLHPRGAGVKIGGEAWLRRRNGEVVDILSLSEKQHRLLRGNEMGMVFQEPMTSLNPVLSIGHQLAETAQHHLGMNRTTAWQHAEGLLRSVEMPDPQRCLTQYPHQLSGGMRQRVMIAIAITCEPTLLIADEPTTALDVTIQAQILALLKRIQQEKGMSILLITHNLALVAQYADHVAVMYAGRIVEESPVHELFSYPQHPYTHGLLACFPSKESLLPVGGGGGAKQRLITISGQVPGPRDRPKGCGFASRCPRRIPACEAELPLMTSISPTHQARCIFP